MAYRGRDLAQATMILMATLLIVSQALAHDPAPPEVDIPEVSVVVERPVSASSRQFI
ncbi:MAG: hypothetical protein ABIU05_18465 [Nitrospirales bacterium]